MATVTASAEGDITKFDDDGNALAADVMTLGTPVFADFTNSGDTVAVRIPVCGSAPCLTFTGTIATGQNVTLTGVTITAGNP